MASDEDEVARVYLAIDEAMDGLDRALDRIEATGDPDERVRELVSFIAEVRRMHPKVARMRREEAIRLYEEGDLSFAELGCFLGVSKARAHQMLKGHVKKNRESTKAAVPLPVPALAEMEIGEELLATALYRLYNSEGILLYVGIADNLKSRFDRHKTEKLWWGQVARKTVTWYGSRNEAFRAEDIAIKNEHPLHNIAGKPRERLTA